MTEQQFEEYSKLKQKEKNIKIQLECLNSKSSSKDIPIIEEESARIILTYGNGNWQYNIGNDTEILLEIKELIETKLLIKLKEIKETMDNL